MTTARLERMKRSPQFARGVFHNGVPTTVIKPGATFAMMRAAFESRGLRVPSAPLPLVDPLPRWSAQPGSGLRVTWLGHSTLYLELEGVGVLTDPMFSERSSPVRGMGPKRFHPPPVALSALPSVDAVLVSHDHYDHLDAPAIRQLAARRPRFFVPLGVGAYLSAWGVPEEDIVELDWWEGAELPGKPLKIVCTPARHFSARGAFDRGRTLWSSFVVESRGRRVYFSGDTGLTPELGEIGARHGPFELVALEIGAFHPSWGDIHLGPENALAAQRMLGGGPLLPIHWGTFSLGLHAWTEPIETLVRLASEQRAELLAPRLGAPVEPASRPELDAWWRAVAGR